MRWSRSLVEANRVKSPPEVWNELSKTSRMTEWLRLYKNSVIDAPTTDVEYLLLAGQITNQFPAMAGARGRKNVTTQVPRS